MTSNRRELSSPHRVRAHSVRAVRVPATNLANAGAPATTTTQVPPGRVSMVCAGGLARGLRGVPVMTSMPIRNPETDHLLTSSNCAIIFIDFQPIQVAAVQSMERRALVENVVNVAKTAKIFGLPVVLSIVNGQSSIPPLVEVLRGAPEIDRTQMNAWEDREFVAAVKATGRRKLVFCALWTEICLSLPVLDALREGYECYPVVDAVGGTSGAAHEAALRRIEQAGARPVSWTSLLGELQRDWARTETAGAVGKVLFTVEGK